jgi:hypothetical protein
MIGTTISRLLVASSLLASAHVEGSEGTAAAQAVWVFEQADGQISRQPMDPSAEIDLSGLEASFIRHEGLSAPDVSEPFDFRAATLTLNNGDRVLGVPRAGEGDRLEFALAVGASVTVDVDALSSLVFQARVADGRPAHLGAPEQGDRLYWVTGGGLDPVDGTLEAFTAEGVRFDSLLGSREFKWDEVAALYIEALDEREQPQIAGGTAVVCDLTDGGRLHGSCTSLGASGCRLVIAGGRELSLPIASLVEILVDDGRVAFLSDRPLLEVAEGSPFDDDLGLRWPHRVDLSVTGKPLSVGGRVWRRGLGVHAPSRLTWDLDGEWRELRGLVGIDDEVLSLPHRGAVNFRLWLDQREVWSSGTVRGGEGVREIPTLALGGASKLTLEVDMDAQSFVADRADWLRVLLVK